MKPNCYNCVHRGTIPGDSHSKCNHPCIKSDILIALSEILGMGSLPINAGSAKELSVVGNDHGIRNGWFRWPVNFDPAWLENCNGYSPIEKPWWNE